MRKKITVTDARELNDKLRAELMGPNADTRTQARVEQFMRIRLQLLKQAKALLDPDADFLEGSVSWNQLTEEQKIAWMALLPFVNLLPHHSQMMGYEFRTLEIVSRLIPAEYMLVEEARQIIDWWVARLLEYLRLRYEAGDGIAIIDAVNICAGYTLPLPEWAALAFCDKYSQLLSYEFRTLDQAFGAFHRKHLDVDAQERRAELGQAAAWLKALKEAEGVPVGEGMWDEIGEELGIPGPTLSKMYYKWYKDFLLWNGRDHI